MSLKKRVKVIVSGLVKIAQVILALSANEWLSILQNICVGTGLGLLFYGFLSFGHMPLELTEVLLVLFCSLFGYFFGYSPLDNRIYSWIIWCLRGIVSFLCLDILVLAVLFNFLGDGLNVIFVAFVTTASCYAQGSLQRFIDIGKMR